MGKIIAVANQKGGVGKTTTAVNLAAGLGEKGRKTLIIDLDPQGNATSGFGVSKKDPGLSSYDLMVRGEDTRKTISRTKFANVSIIPSHMNLAGAEIELFEMENPQKILRAALVPVKNEFDFIIIDCPPSLGLMTVNALAAADSVLIPIQPEYYALEGLSQLTGTIKRVRRAYNPSLDLEGILLTMYDARLNLTLQVVEEVKKHFAGKIFSSIIPRNVRLSEAPSYGQPIMYYDRSSKGTAAYQNLADEIIAKNGRRN